MSLNPIASLGVQQSLAGLQLTPQQLTAKIQWYRVTSREIENFLKMVEGHAQEFNQIHWAVFSGKLHEISKTNIQLSDDQIGSIKRILSHLSECKDNFSPGQIAQIIGSCIPFVIDNPKMNQFLFNLLKQHCGRLDKQEIIMVLHGIGKEPQAKNYINLIYNVILKRRDLDLNAALFYVRARLNIANNQDFEELIAPHITQFSLKRLGVILGAMGFYQHRNFYFPADAIKQLGDVFVDKVFKSKDPKIIKESILLGAVNLTCVRYLNPEWIRFCLTEISQFEIWDKINILYSLIQIGVNSSNSPLTGSILKDVAVEYIQPKYEQYRRKYPRDIINLAFSVSAYFKSFEQELTGPLIGLALPYVKTEDDKSTMRKAIELSDFPQKAVSKDILNYCSQEEVIRSQLQNMFTRKFKERMKRDQRFASATLKTEFQIGHSFVDIVIKGFAKDRKLIAIEIDGRYHRIVGQHSQPSPQNDTGKTQIKHYLVQKNGCHLVVIRSEGIEDPNNDRYIEDAWDQIVVLGLPSNL